MSDCINREAVKQIIAAQCGECADACLEFDGIQPDCNQCLLYGAKKAIESIPAADVRPVERGKWLGTHDGFYYSYSCSECGYEALYKENTKDQVCSSFCPNCGANMRPTSMSGANGEEI